ncbi:MAG: alpha amylase C-terminal domain-containing protein, partial [Emticicia sp.]|uniref:alpha amylase C-terminal domain-containing protein n=1 Tax=Emticicia sp. TaxID=1930953 RepID=UPI003BA59AFA
IQVGFPGPGSWRMRFNSDWEGYDNDFDNHFTQETVIIPQDINGKFISQLSVGAYSTVIYSHD